MSVQISIRSIALAAPLLVWGVGFGLPTNTARADGCLAKPNSPAPEGQHWYYHTDRKKGRKCWFLRELIQLPQHTATQGKPAATRVTHTSASEKPASSTTTPEPVQRVQSATPSEPEPPALQAGTPWQTGAPAIVAALAVPIILPDVHPVETIKIRKPNSGPSDAGADHAHPTMDARPPKDPEDTARTGVPTTHAAGITTSPAAMPVEMILVVALALAVAGLLYRLVMKIAARRGQRIVVDYSPPLWADDRPQRVRLDEPRQQGPVQGRERKVTAREQFVDGLHVSLVPAASDDGVRHPLLGVDASPYKPRRKRVAAPAAGGISEHENNLAQLIRDLDHLLQTRKGA